jgi:hypothetical protein
LTKEMMNRGFDSNISSPIGMVIKNGLFLPDEKIHSFPLSPSSSSKEENGKIGASSHE